jgi:phosphate transport system substrate-binding protein
MTNIVFLLAAVLSLWSGAVVGAEEERRRITVAGAQSLVPMAERFAAEYRKRQTGVEISIRSGGSNFAVEAVRRGEVDIGMVTRALAEEEKVGLFEEALTPDAIMLLTYPTNPVTNLSLDQIKAVYFGRLINWRQLGGSEKGIVPLMPERGSTIRAMFMEQLTGKSFAGHEKAFALRASKERLLKTIKRIEGALGYGIVNAEDARLHGVKVLEVERHPPTKENLIAKSYPFARQRVLIAKKASDNVVQECLLALARFAREQEPIARKRS